MPSRFHALALVVLLASGCGGSSGTAGTPSDTEKRLHQLYAFVSPATAANTVVILTLNAFSGATMPDTFSTAQTYSVLIDNDADFIEDHAFHVTFGELNGNSQPVMVRDAGGQVLASGDTGEDLAMVGGGTFRAAEHDDPAFVDGKALADVFADGIGTFPRNPAHNLHLEANCLAIVIERPSDTLTGPGSSIGIWARATTGVPLTQVDRVGRPYVAAWMLPKLPHDDAVHPDLRGSFCTSDDLGMDPALFGAGMTQVISDFWGNPANAASLTAILLPDLLTIDTSNMAGFLNGRRLEDDVVDALVNLLTNGGTTTDDVTSDSVFSATFPYLAAPNVPGAGPNPN